MAAQVRERLLQAAMPVFAAWVSEVTCPAGQTTRQRSRTRQKTGDRYQFKTAQFAFCSLRAECLENPAGTRGRLF